jgi:hypothetical protein
MPSRRISALDMSTGTASDHSRGTLHAGSKPSEASGVGGGSGSARADTIPPVLADFYQKAENFAVLRDINGSSPLVSLRALAWFVSNGVEDAQMREDYERNLRAFTRRKFDPFRRCDRLVLAVGSDSVVTTVGQMNFFKWMIERGLWKFVAENRARVSAEVARRSVASARVSAKASRSGGARSNGDAGQAACMSGFSQVCGRHVVVFD